MESAKVFTSLGFCRCGSAAFRKTLLKPVHTTRGIDQLLFAGKKRVAGGADFDAQVVAHR